MNDDFDIEIQGEENGIESHIQLPMNILAFGEIENDDVKVYIKQDVYKALEKYALADTSTERGTIILGDYCEELGKTHVIISSYIEAKFTDASASTLTFTHETWEYVHQQHDKLYPNTKIVGWQHTHPSYGIFLSNYDLFIQENFFNMPFQVAYVIDPIQNLRGFFQWKNGRIEKLKGFYVYDEIGKPIKVEHRRISEKQEGDGEKHRFSNILSFVLFAFLLLSTVCFGYISFKLNREIKEQQKQFISLEQAVALHSQDISAIKNTSPEHESEQMTNETTRIEQITQIIESQQTAIEEHGKLISDLQDHLNEYVPNDKNDRVVFIKHRVQQGDTIIGICRTYNIDFASNQNLIVAINGLSDVNKICIGETLLLPLAE